MCSKRLTQIICTKEEFHKRVVQVVNVFTKCRETRSLRECVYDTCLHGGDKEVVRIYQIRNLTS